MRVAMARLRRFARHHEGLLMAALALALVVIRYLHAELALYAAESGCSLSTADYVIYAVFEDATLPGAWLFVPGVSVLFCSALWSREDNPAFVACRRSRAALWLGQMGDALLASAVSSLAYMSLVVLSSCASAGVTCNFGDSSSLFALRTGQVLAQPPSLASVVIAALCLTFLASSLVLACFASVRLLVGSSAAGSVVLVPSLPVVHDTNSFVYDVVRNLSGGLLGENPLHALYSLSSVSWGTWLDGAGHNLWMLPLEMACVALVVLPAVSLRDFLPVRVE